RGAHLFPHRLPRACGSSCAYPLRSRSLASSLHRLAAEADLRRTQLTRGEATLLSSHAGDPRAAAGDTTNVGQTGWSTPATRVSPSPAREPTPRVGRRRPVRSSVTGILRHRLPLQAHGFASLLVGPGVLDADGTALAVGDDFRVA